MLIWNNNQDKIILSILNTNVGPKEALSNLEHIVIILIIKIV